MNNLTNHALIIALAMSLGACNQDGAIGPVGATGATGATGASGLNGSNGTNAPIGMQLTAVGRYQTGTYGAGAAEIVAWHQASKTAYVLNGAANRIDLVSLSQLKSDALSDPLTANNLTAQQLAIPSTVTTELDGHRSQTVSLGMANSISVRGNLLAVAVEQQVRTEPGIVLLYDIASATPQLRQAVLVGVQPDMLTFSADGQLLLVANEGEPSPDYQVDPVGSVSVLQISGTRISAVKQLGFDTFDAAKATLTAAGVKFAGPPGTSVSQDVEPEYITVSPDNRKAWVSLQENNALAVVDLANFKIEKIVPLGFKDHSLPRNSLDVSNKDGVNLQTVPGLYGMYQPDTIQSYSWHGVPFIVTANEGDARDWPGFSEQKRVASIKRSALLQSKQNYTADGLGRLNITTAMGQNAQGDYDALYAYGARSFSIWDQNGQQVFDSGNDFERISSALHGSKFNTSHSTVEGDSRSDDKGPEPEALAIGVMAGRTFAFIGTERMSSIFVYDISNPYAPNFVDYHINRDLDAIYAIDDSQSPAKLSGNVAQAGDLGPESLYFIPATESPTKQPLLMMANEVSGTLSVFELAVK